MKFDMREFGMVSGRGRRNWGQRFIRGGTWRDLVRYIGMLTCKVDGDALQPRNLISLIDSKEKEKEISFAYSLP
jgi:hypothetical protein